MMTTEKEATRNMCAWLSIGAEKAKPCKASDCMAWRWFGWAPDADRNAWIRTNNSRRSDYDDDHVRVGYCGLAGRPE